MAKQTVEKKTDTKTTVTIKPKPELVSQKSQQAKSQKRSKNGRFTK